MLLVVIVALVITGHWTLVVAILGLALLIFVHELGHFLAAKAFHMRVERFYIGFPPAVVKRTWGETEYGIGSIPLGGFCKISGMTPDEKLPDEVAPRAYSQQAGLAAQHHDLRRALHEHRCRGAHHVRLHPDGRHPEAHADHLPGRQGHTRGGGGTAGGRSPGLGQRRNLCELEHDARLHRVPPAQDRDAHLPHADRSAAHGRCDAYHETWRRHQGFLGISPGGIASYPAPWHAAQLAVTDTASIVGDTFKGFWMLVSGKVNPAGPNGAAGPVGIISISQTAVRQSWYPILLAFISVNLGIVNLLPFLPFDGGHIFFNVVETVRGRRVDARVLERAIAIGVVVLVTLFILLTYNDLRRIFHLS